MEVAIPHQLGRDEVRSRMRARSHMIADGIPGGMAQVNTGWPTEDRMKQGRFLRGQTTWLAALRRGPVGSYLWWPSDSRDIADILTTGPRPDMACVVRLTAYLAAKEPDLGRR